MDGQTKLQEGLVDLREMEKELSILMSNRQLLDSQLKENEVVHEELKLLSDDNQVYKMVGSVLLKQDKEESISNVSKRIEFIKNELKKSENKIGELQRKFDNKQQEILQVQKNIVRSNV